MKTIKELGKQIKKLELERDELKFAKEFKGLKPPRMDTVQMARISQENKIPDSVALEYEKVMKDMLYTAFNDIKKACWDYWSKNKKYENR